MACSHTITALGLCDGDDVSCGFINHRTRWGGLRHDDSLTMLEQWQYSVSGASSSVERSAETRGGLVQFQGFRP